MIIVTGAAGFLGQAVVKHLSAQHHIAAVDLAATIPMAGQSASYGGVDLGDATAVKACYAQIAAHDTITGLVNIAGGFAWETLGDGAAATWEKMYHLNVQTTVHSCMAALPYLRASKGVVVNTAANAAAKAAAGMGAYTASKAGVMRLTEALAAEELDAGVRVNAIMPSIIDTPVNRKDMPDADYDRWVSPAALADVIGFLLSDESRAITGACVPVVGRVQ